MVYLIGGPPRTGKTTLAAALAQRTSCPYFSIDHIVQVIVPYIGREEHASRFPLRMARQETRFNNDLFYEKYSAEQTVDLYLRQAETCWPGVENFINYAVGDDHTLILEGWQILPHRLRDVTARPDRMRAVFLYKRSVADIAAALRSHVAENDWVRKNTKKQDTFDAIAKMISCFGATIERDAAVGGFPAVNTDQDFASTIDRTLASMLG